MGAGMGRGPAKLLIDPYETIDRAFRRDAALHARGVDTALWCRVPCGRRRCRMSQAARRSVPGGLPCDVNVRGIALHGGARRATAYCGRGGAGERSAPHDCGVGGTVPERPPVLGLCNPIGPGASLAERGEPHLSR